MGFTEKQIAQLSAPLDKGHVATRQQAGRNLSYIEGWHAIAEANRIFGFEAWNRETVELRQLGDPILGKDRNGNDQWRVNYLCRVRITVYDQDGSETIRDGSGFGQGIDKDVGQAHESALKEAETDAMKRALMTFGNPFGLALYDKSQANVAAAPREPSKPVELTREQLDAIAKLDECDSPTRLKVWSEDNRALIDAAPQAVQDVMAASFAKRKEAIQAMNRHRA